MSLSMRRYQRPHRMKKRPLDLRHVKIAMYFLFIYDSSSKTEKGIPPGGGLSGFWLGMGPRNSLEVNDVN